MSMLAKEDRKDLVWAMRTSLLESVRSGVLTEGKKAAAENFIINEATYEQLLNLAFNPERDTNYKSTQVLEKVALESYNSILEAEQTEEAKEEAVEESVFAAIEKAVVTEGEKWEKMKGKIKEISKSAADKMKAAGKHVVAHKGKYFVGIGGAAITAAGVAAHMKHKNESTETEGEVIEESVVTEGEKWEKMKGKFREVTKAVADKMKAAGKHVVTHKGKYFVAVGGTAITGAGVAAYLKHRRENKK